MTEELSLILSDTTNRYIYGPGGVPVEQISSGGTITYLHHDQQGSTRLLSSDVGLIYMRARVYDPATAQFLTQDPLEAITGEP